MRADKETPTATGGTPSNLETKLSGLSAKDLQHMSSNREAIRKTLALRWVSTLLILVAAQAVPLLLILKASGSVEWEGGKEVLAVIVGLLGLLFSVRLNIFIEDRQRRLSIRKLRISKKEFFERVERDLSSRLTEKVR